MLDFSYNISIMFLITLYPADSRVGRGNLVLKHSVLHFPPSSVFFIIFSNSIIDIHK